MDWSPEDALRAAEEEHDSPVVAVARDELIAKPPRKKYSRDAGTWWFKLGATEDEFVKTMMDFKCHTSCKCWEKAMAPKGGAQKVYGTDIRTILRGHYRNLRSLAELGRETYEASQLTALQLALPSNVAARVVKGVTVPLHPQAYPFGAVCLITWCRLFGVGTNRLKRLRTILRRPFPSTVPEEHGNTGRKPAVSRSEHDVDEMVKCVLNYALLVGERRPVRRSSVGGAEDQLHFPANVTRSSLHNAYVQWLKEERPNAKPISLSVFKRTLVRDDRLRLVVFRPPRTDVCGDCTMFRNRIAAQPTDLSRMSEEERVDVEARTAELTGEFNLHIERATEVREVMKRRETHAVECAPADRRATSDVELCFTLGYAQNMAIPQIADQVGPMYLMSLRNYYLFGVRDAASDIQFNFVYDEAGEFGGKKKASNVASLLWYLFTDVPGTSIANAARLPRVIHLFADNCGGQNKNKTILWLLVLLAQSGLELWKEVEEISLTFPIRGHTRNSLDRGFGVIKKKFIKSNVYTLDQATDLINGLGNQVGIKVSSRRFRNFEGYCIHRDFKGLPGVSKQQFFRARRDNPGVVEYKVREKDEWKEFQLVPDDHLASLGNFEWTSVDHMKEPILNPLKAYDLRHKALKYIPEEYHNDYLPERAPRSRPLTVARRHGTTNAAQGKKPAASSSSSSSTTTTTTSSATTTTTPRPATTSANSTHNKSNGLSESADGSRKRSPCAVCGKVGHSAVDCKQIGGEDDMSDDSGSDFFGPRQRKRRAVPDPDCLDCGDSIQAVRGGVVCPVCSEWVQCHREHDDTRISDRHLAQCVRK